MWRPTHELGTFWAAGNHGLWNASGNLATGIVTLLLIAVFACFGHWFVGSEAVFGRRARRWAGRLFLAGLACGAVGLIPGAGWLLFGRPPVSLVLGAVIGSSLAASVGMLAGAGKLS